MAKTIQGFISAKTGLVPAFKEIADLPEGQDGILRIETADLEGELALSKSRYITGAFVQTSGAKGVDALKVLLSARKGSFRYAHVEDGFAIELQQRIRLDIHKLVAESADEDDSKPAPSTVPAAKVDAPPATTSSNNVKALPPDSPKASSKAPSTRYEGSGQRLYADNFDDDDEDEYNSFGRSSMAPMGESLFATEDPADADDDEWLQRLAKPKRDEALEREAKAKAEKEEAEKEAKARAEKEAAEKEAKARAEKEAAEKEAKARAEKEAAEKEAKARAEKEAAEKEAKALKEKEAAEKEAKALKEKEAAEKEAKALKEKEAAEKEAKALKEKEAAEKEAKALKEKEAAEKEAKALKEKETSAKEAKARAAREAAEREAKALEDEAAEKEAKALKEKEAAEKEAKALEEKEAAEKEAKAVEKEAAEREAKVAAAREAARAATASVIAKEAATEKQKQQDEERAEIFNHVAEADSSVIDQRETATLKNLKSLPIKPVQSQLARRQDSKVRPKTEMDYDFGKVDPTKLPASKSATNLDAMKPATGEELIKPTEVKEPTKKAQWSVPSRFEAVHAAGAHTGAPTDEQEKKEDFSDIDPDIERELAIAYGGADPDAEVARLDSEEESDKESKQETATEAGEETDKGEDVSDEETSAIPSTDKTSESIAPESSTTQNKMSALGQLRADAVKAAEGKGAVPSQLKRPASPADKPKGIDISELDAIKTPSTAGKPGDVAASASDDAAGDESESWVAKVVSSAKQEKVRASQMKMAAMAPIPEAPKKEPITPSVRGKIDTIKKDPKQKSKLFDSKLNRVAAAVIGVGVLVGAVTVGRTLLAESIADRAATLMKNKDYKGALAEVNTALTIDGGLKVAHFNKAQIEAKLNDDLTALNEFNAVITDDPNHAGALEHRAELFIKLVQYQLALADLNRLMQLEGNKPTLSLLSNRAYASLMLGNNMDALANYTSALQQSGKDPQLLIGRALSYGNLKQFDKAQKDLDKAIKLNPKNASAYTARAKVYLAQKNFDMAFADFNRALAIAPGDAAVLTQKGASLGDAGQFDQALNSLSQAIKINKTYVEAYRQRARILTLQHKYPEALADIAQLGKVSGMDADYYRQRGDIFNMQGADSKALESYSSSISKTPTSASLEGRAGLYAKKNDFKSAVADIATAITLNSTDSNLYVQKAIYEDKLGDSKSASTDFTKAISLYPLNLKAHLAHGRFLLKQQEASSAEEAYDTALKIDPKSAEAKQGKLAARTLFAHQHPRSAAPMPDIATSDRVDPQDQKLITSGSFAELISSGYKQLRSGNNERAIALLAKAVRLNPNDANARRYLAAAFRANGDTENEMAMLRAIVAINPGSTADSVALGDSLVKSGHVEDAIDTYSKTLSSDKHNIKARCALARAYMSAGFKQKAKDVCEEGIREASSPAETAALKATLGDIDSGAAAAPAQRNNTPPPLDDDMRARHAG